MNNQQWIESLIASLPAGADKSERAWVHGVNECAYQNSFINFDQYKANDKMIDEKRLLAAA